MTEILIAAAFICGLSVGLAVGHVIGYREHRRVAGQQVGK